MYIATGVFGKRRAEHVVGVDGCIFGGVVPLLDRGVVHPNIPLWSNRII